MASILKYGMGEGEFITDEWGGDQYIELLEEILGISGVLAKTASSGFLLGRPGSSDISWEVSGE